MLAHPVMEQQMAILSSILENFPMPFFLVDPSLRVTHINDHMEKLTGYSLREVVGRMTCGEASQYCPVRYLRLRAQAGHGAQKAHLRTAPGGKDPGRPPGAR